jgi:hypothetical protein
MSNQPVEATETRGSVWSTQTSGVVNDNYFPAVTSIISRH